MKLFQIFILFFLTVNLSFSQTLKGDRILAWQVDMSENNNYDSAYFYATKGCMESIHLTFTWNNIEPDNGVFSQNFINNILDVSNIYYPANGTKVELQIPTMNTNVKTTPTDLLTIDFDNPLMINRFKILLDTLFQHIPNLELSLLNIGNESDIFMNNDSISYVKYKTFLDSVIPHAKELYYNIHQSELKVGTTFTLHGLTSASKKSLCQLVNNNLDVVSTTYYPINSDFTMQSPLNVFTDFSELVSVYPNSSQPIYFVECGYSSSSTCNSSEELQAEFYENVFQSWDNHYNNIKYITIFKSTDWSSQEVTDIGTYYGITDSIFLEYLRTLGVRNWDNDGSNKLAYNTILCELNSREWCNVTCAIPSSKEELTNQNVNLYPNPVNETLTINANEKFIEILIYDCFGKLLIKSSSDNINCNKLKSGIYYTSIKFESGRTKTKKFIKL